MMKHWENFWVGGYNLSLPWKPTDKYYYISGSINEPSVKLGSFSENEIQAMEYYFQSNCYKNIEDANKYLSEYVFLLNDRFTKFFGI